MLIKGLECYEALKTSPSGIISIMKFTFPFPLWSLLSVQLHWHTRGWNRTAYVEKKKKKKEKNGVCEKCRVWKVCLWDLLGKFHELLSWITLSNWIYEFHGCMLLWMMSQSSISFKNISANSNLPVEILCKAEHYKNTTTIALTAHREIPFHEKKKS